MSEIPHCHEPGLLVTFTQPKSSSYLHEFHDWYNTEHGPARLKLDFVENGYRYNNLDKPQTWVAMYDLKNVSAVAGLQYSNLQSHVSLREQQILQNILEVTDNKIYKHVSTRGSVHGPAPVITCVVFVVDRNDVEEVHRWYEEQHISDLSQIPGWRRSRRFELVEGDVLPGCVELLAIHEFDEKNGLGGPQHMRARYRPWREKIVQLAKSRMNQELRFCHEFRAEDYLTPPDTVMTAHIGRRVGDSTRRSSLASGHEHSKHALIGMGIGQTVLPQVH